MSENIYEPVAAHWCVLHDFARPCPMCLESYRLMTEAFLRLEGEPAPCSRAHLHYPYVKCSECGQC